MKPKTRPALETWLVVVVVFALCPLALAFLALLWWGAYDLKLRLTLSLLVVVAALWCILFLHEKIVVRLRNISSLLSSLREGEASHRLEIEPFSGAMAEVVMQANRIGDLVSEQRKGVAETHALLEKVVAEMDAAVFTFDAMAKCRLVNARGTVLLGKPEDEIIHRHAGALGLAACLEGPVPRVIGLDFGPMRRWEIRRASFRELGRENTLVMLTDLTESLRREELDAWQRLVRVLRHEISNSLAPMRSVAETLLWQIENPAEGHPGEANLREGLQVISRRASALNRMIKSYAGVADLPPPDKRPVPVADWVARVTALFARNPPLVHGGPEVTLMADGDQLDQLLLNLIKNGLEAARENGGQVEVAWRTEEDHLMLEIRDEGPGITDSPDLFVPFFTTKEDGSGVGLLVSRNITEAHQGSLTLTNRSDGPGCIARVTLPLGEISGGGPPPS